MGITEICAIISTGIGLIGVMCKVIHTLTKLDDTVNLLQETIDEQKSFNKNIVKTIHEHENRINALELRDGKD